MNVRNTFRTALAAGGLVGLMGIGILPQTTSAQSRVPVKVHPIRRVIRQRRPRNENHHDIVRALKALGRARQMLTNAKHDFHGYRAHALELTDQAIEQCHLALKSDRK